MRNKDPLGKVKGTDAIIIIILIIRIIILYYYMIPLQQQHALVNERPRELVLLSFFFLDRT